MSNFLFLKKNNPSLFNIISEAEKLFRDEYFEQAVVQTRRFAENLCKELLQEKALPDDTFDSMISKIKDNSFSNMRMKELAEDLYFLKKHGNNSAHSSNTSQNGKIALECLERAYEVAVYYSNIKFGYDKKLDKSVFSEEVLMTGKKTSKKQLKEKYAEELTKARTTKTKIQGVKPKKTKPAKKPTTNVKKKSKKKNKKAAPIMSIIVLVALIILACYIFINL